MGLEASTVHQLSRICDFDMVASRRHAGGGSRSVVQLILRATALPTLSVLQAGLVAASWPDDQPGRSELGASVAWLTRHRAGPVVMMAAITAQADTKDGLEVIVEDEVVCALCGNPMITIGSNVKWIGPRRGVRRRRVFPACSECCAPDESQRFPLRCPLRPDASSDHAIRGVIRGGGQGDGRPRGALRLVRIDDEHDKP